MDMPKHFSLLKEHPASFEIHDKRDNSSFHIAKQHLDNGGFAKIKSMQKFYDGGVTQNDQAQGKKDNNPQQPPQPIGDPQKVADAQASLRGAFHFADGTPKGGVPSVNLTAEDIDPNAASNTVQLSAADLDPNAVVNPGYDKPTPTAQAIDDAYAKQQADNVATPEDTANNLAGLVGDKAPYPQKPEASDSQVDGEISKADQAASGVTPASAQGATQDQGAPSDEQGTSGIKQASMRVSPNVSSSANPRQLPATQVTAAPVGPVPGSVDDYTQQMQKTLDDLNSPNGSYAKLASAMANNKINPDDYWKDHSKVAASIGIILGGFAQGLGHTTTNQALAVIQDGIKRSMDAQEKNQGKDMDLLKLNQGNKIATMNQLYTMAQVTIAKQAQQTNSAQAKLQGQLLVQEIQAKKNENAIRGQSLQFLSNPANNNPAAQNGPINYAKLTAMKNAGLITPEQENKAMTEATNYINLSKQTETANSAFDELGKEKGIMGVPEALGYKPVAEIAFDNAVAPFVKDEAGRPSPELLHEAQQFKPKPWDSPGRVQEKRVAFNNWTQGRAATPTLDQLGVVNPQFKQRQLQMTQGGPQGIQYMNGKAYQRVGNMMVPVGGQKPMVAGR